MIFEFESSDEDTPTILTSKPAIAERFFSPFTAPGLNDDKDLQCSDDNIPTQPTNKREVPASLPVSVAKSDDRIARSPSSSPTNSCSPPIDHFSKIATYNAYDGSQPSKISAFFDAAPVDKPKKKAYDALFAFSDASSDSDEELRLNQSFSDDESDDTSPVSHHATSKGQDLLTLGIPGVMSAPRTGTTPSSRPLDIRSTKPGTSLDRYGCTFIRNHLKQATPVAGDTPNSESTGSFSP